MEPGLAVGSSAESQVGAICPPNGCSTLLYYTAVEFAVVQGNVVQRSLFRCSAIQCMIWRKNQKSEEWIASGWMYPRMKNQPMSLKLKIKMYHNEI